MLFDWDAKLCEESYLYAFREYVSCVELVD